MKRRVVFGDGRVIPVGLKCELYGSVVRPTVFRRILRRVARRFGRRTEQIMSAEEMRVLRRDD